MLSVCLSVCLLYTCVSVCLFLYVSCILCVSSMGQVAGIKRDDDDDDFTESCGVNVTGGVTYLILLTLSSFLFAAHAHTVAACFAVVPMLCHLFLIFLWVYKKSSPYSITERRVPELIPVLGSQPACDVSYKPGGRLPLLSARPAVTPTTLKRAATNYAAWWTEARWVWTVCLRLLSDCVAAAIWTRALLHLSPAR